MDWTTTVFMIVPAILIATMLGILVVLALTGESAFREKRIPVAATALGALTGSIVFLLTDDWWPPVIGPFILSPAGSILASLIAVAFLKRRSRQGSRRDDL